MERKIFNKSFKDINISIVAVEINNKESYLYSLELKGKNCDFDGSLFISSRKFDSLLKANIAKIVLLSQLEKGYFCLLEWKMKIQSLYYFLEVDNKENCLINF